MPATASAEHAPPVGSDSERRRSGCSTGLVSAVPEATAAETRAKESMYDRSAMFDTVAGEMELKEEAVGQPTLPARVSMLLCSEDLERPRYPEF